MSRRPGLGKVNASKAKTGDITCGGEVLKQVTAFIYLGSLIIEASCRKAQAAFCILRPVGRSNCISLWTKLRIFDSNVKSVLLYGSETWRLTKRIIAKLQVLINRTLRYILEVRIRKLTRFVRSLVRFR